MPVSIPQFAQMCIRPLTLLGSVLTLAIAAHGQADADRSAGAVYGSINTPHTTYPSARATQPGERAKQDLP
jgi:hypothetical protein